MKHPAAAYGVAILLTGAALLIFRLAPGIFVESATPPFIAAVLLSSWFGGLWPGLLTVLLSTILIEGLGLPPNTRPGLGVEDIPRETAFLLVAWLTSQQRKANESVRAEMAERRRSEEALRKAEADLARVARVTTLGEMAATIAHEVNQPLAAMVANGNACLRWLAGETPNLDKVRGAVELIVSDGHRAGKVISQVRALVEKAPPVRRPIDVNRLVLDTVALARRTLDENDVTIQTDLSTNLPAVNGDHIQLEQVLLNLIINAVDAMNTVADRPRRLSIRSRPAAEIDGLQIDVRDSGVGFGAKDKERIFDPFFSTKPESMGLGLAISRSIVVAHGGRMWADPNPDGGATFSFLIPAAREDT
ncbi:MAG TPA: ATP-binding protein [Candidatus Binataceae bacterium]|nr:ATP-binding protein [Candidatus Binataceae bacterium]